MEHILGKVTAHGAEQTGPDVLLDLVVERDWLRDAKTVDIELPRHLCCASCQGAGCSICGHSGALTLRERSELGEIVRVTLPQQDPDSISAPDSARVLTLKVPGHGGLPEPESTRASRGRLLIRISTNGPISSCIRAVAPASELDAREQVPSGVLSASVQTAEFPAAAATNHAPAPQATHVGAAPAPDDSLTRTAPSVLPSAAARAATQRRAKQPSAPNLSSTARVVEPSIGWTWKDTLIGFLVLILGAFAAWVFIAP